jgi:hypothetical protein
VFGTPDPLKALPKLSAYWAAVQTDPIVGRLVDETRQAIAGVQAQASALAAGRKG